MKKYIVEMSKTAEQDLENVAGSMAILNENLTGHKNIRKINVRNYIVFYVVDEENSKALILRIGYSMNFFTNKEKGNTGLGIAIAYFSCNEYTVSIPLKEKHIKH